MPEVAETHPRLTPRKRKSKRFIKFKVRVESLYLGNGIFVKKVGEMFQITDINQPGPAMKLDRSGALSLYSFIVHNTMEDYAYFNRMRKAEEEPDAKV